MQQLYREYNEMPKLQPLLREISWAKNLVTLGRCQDPRKAQTARAVKDHYTFDVLELAEERRERQLEQAPIAKLRNFLAELGGAFAFIGVIICRARTSPLLNMPCAMPRDRWTIAAYLVRPNLLENIQSALPSREQITEQLSAWSTANFDREVPCAS